jgi:hypothetical protein
VRITLLSVLIFLVVLTPTIGCNPAPSPKVVYEEGEPEASQTDEVPLRDLAKLRTWQPGSTAGNNHWLLRIL